MQRAEIEHPGANPRSAIRDPPMAGPPGAAQISSLKIRERFNIGNPAAAATRLQQLIDDPRQTPPISRPRRKTPVFPRAIADQFTGDLMPQRQALTLEIDSRSSVAV
jgi:hypothetical protein